LSLEPIKERGVVSIGDLIGLSYTGEAQQRSHKREGNKKRAEVSWIQTDEKGKIIILLILF